MHAPAASPTYRVAADPGVRVLVSSLGLACCAMEVDAAVRLGLLVEDTAGPVERSVVLVSGTVTEALVPVVRAVAAQEGVFVVAFGACASTGGPYWDAPTVVNGADTVVPVAWYVPGCPPRPQALVDALIAAGAPA